QRGGCTCLRQAPPVKKGIAFRMVGESGVGQKAVCSQRNGMNPVSGQRFSGQRDISNKPVFF
ncbi:hypothetical protein, partial [Pantoea ananatis]